MPLKRAVLERQLEQTQAFLDRVKAELLETGVAESDLPRQTKYRDVSADLRALKRRLRALAAKAAVGSAEGGSEEEE